MSREENQLFVGRLPRGTRSSELEDVFYKYGKMTRCDVKQGIKMAYGFIEYEDKRDAEDSLRGEHGRDFNGARIVVEWARGPKDTPGPRDRHRDAGRHDDRERYREDDRYREREYRRDDRRYQSRSRSPHYNRRRSNSRSPEKEFKRRSHSRSRSPEYNRRSHS